MPIGKFADFKALKGALLSRAEKRIKDPNAYTASVARKMEPNFDQKAAKTRHDEAMMRGASARASRRNR